MTSTDRINYLNVALMLVSAAIAFVAPFELFVYAYAFMGPAHYLTELSWLHDRKNFISSGREAWVLVIPAVLLMVNLIHPFMTEPGELAALVLGTFFTAAALVFFRGRTAKILGSVALIGVATVMCMAGDWFTPVVLVVPTMIHVFVFTGAFILFGALKSRSKSGLWSFVVFLALPLAVLWYRPSADAYSITTNIQEASAHIRPTHAWLMSTFGLANQWDTVVAVMRLIAFAFTYHYLNWFSKTKIIGWHQTTWQRFVLLGVIYLASIGLYLHDQKTGYTALAFLSLTHVFLEFPLNHRSFVGIGSELRGIARTGFSRS